MEPSFLDHILARPEMYAGIGFCSIDDFSLFFNGLTIGVELGKRNSDVNLIALRGFSVFMRHHLHGENRNCHWEYDLLAKVGSHRSAIAVASVLLLYYRDRLRTIGVHNNHVILGEASKASVYMGSDGLFRVKHI